MLLEQYIILMIAGLASTYLAFNSNTAQKRLLNALLGVISTGTTAIASLRIEIIKRTGEIVQDGSGGYHVIDTVEVVTYSDQIVFVFFTILTILNILYIVQGMYKKVGEQVDI